MDEAERRAIQHECEQLSIAYARHADFREYDALAELFSEDAVLEVGRRLEGRQAIGASFKARPDELRSRHVLTNLFVDVEDEDRASGISYFTLYRHIGPESLSDEPIDFDGPSGVGHYEDEFVRTRDGWRFALRRIHSAFRRRDSMPNR